MKIFSFDYCCGDEFLGGICRHPVGHIALLKLIWANVGVLFIDVSGLFFIKYACFVAIYTNRRGILLSFIFILSYFVYRFTFSLFSCCMGCSCLYCLTG